MALCKRTTACWTPCKPDYNWSKAEYVMSSGRDGAGEGPCARPPPGLQLSTSPHCALARPGTELWEKQRYDLQQPPCCADVHCFAGLQDSLNPGGGTPLCWCVKRVHRLWQ